MIYFVLALAVFFAALIDSSREKSIQGVKTFSTPFLLILFPCILIFLGGFRWLTGTDWNNYYHFYVWHDNWQAYNNGEFEFLYTVLNFICKQISSEYTFFLFIFSSLVVILKTKALRQFTRQCFGITLFLLYCYLTGDILAVRQDLAMSVLFLSIPKIINKEVRWFIIITFIAVLIHNSAVIWFISYPIYWHKRNRRNDILKLFLCFFLGFLGSVLYIKLLTVCINILPASGRVYGKIVAYSVAKYQANYYSILGNVAKRIIVFPILFYYERKANRINHCFSGVFSLYIFGNCLYFLFLSSFTIFQRFTNYFLVLECFLLAQVFFSMKKANKKVYICFLLLYGFLKLYKALSAFSYLKNPYYSIFYYENRSMDWRGDF